MKIVLSTIVWLVVRALHTTPVSRKYTRVAWFDRLFASSLAIQLLLLPIWCIVGCCVVDVADVASLLLSCRLFMAQQHTASAWRPLSFLCEHLFAYV